MTKDRKKTKAQLIEELGELRQRVVELEASEAKMLQTDEMLRESEAMLWELLDAPTDVAALIDNQGVILHANKTMAQRFQTCVDELIGKCVWDLFPSEVTERRKASVDQVVRSGKLLRYEDEREGIWNDNVIYPVLDTQGNVTKVAVLARDITERKRVEVELHRHRDHLDELVSVRTSELSAVNKQLNREIAERKQAEVELIAKVKELETLHRTSVALSLKLDVEELLQFIVTQVADLFDAYSCSILLPDEETGELVFQASADHITGMRVPLGMGIVSRALRTSETQIVNDVAVDPDHYSEIGLASNVTVSNLMAVPLFVDENVVGVLEVLNKRGGDFTRHDSELVVIMASHAAIAIKNAQLFTEAQREVTERARMERLLQALNRASLAMEQALSPAEIFIATANELREMGFLCAVFLTDESQERLSLSFFNYGTKVVQTIEELTGLKAEGFSVSVDRIDEWRQVIREGKTVLVESGEDLVQRWLPQSAKKLANRIISLLRVPKGIDAPLIVEDEIIGLLSVQSDELTEDDLPVITAFAHQMAATWRKAQLFEQAQQEITERKRAERALSESEERYRAIFEQAADSIILIDVETGALVDFNTKAHENLGYSHEEFAYLKIPDFEVMETAEDVARHIEKIAQDGSDSFETKHRTKDGDIREIQVNSRLIIVRGRHFLQSIWRDITERKRNEEELVARQQFLALLNEITQAALATDDLKEMLQTLADRLGELWDADGCYITLWDADHNRAIPSAAYGPIRQMYHTIRPLPGEVTMTESVLQIGHALVAENTHDSPYTSPRIAAMFPARAMLGLPMILGENKLGALLISFDQPHHFTSEDISRGEQVAGQFALAVARARLFEQTQQRADELSALHTTSLEITSSHELSKLLQTIVERAVQLLNALSGGLYLCDPDRREVHCVVSYNTPRDYTGIVLKYGEGAAGIVADTKEPLTIDDYRTWPDRASTYEKEQPFTAVLSAPLIWQGQVSGVIHVLDDMEGRRFTRADIDLLSLFANQAAIAIENARLFEQVRTGRDRLRALSALGADSGSRKEICSQRTA